MASKLSLLKEFYACDDQKIIKIETKKHGLSFWQSLREKAPIDYAQMKDSIYSYRLSIPSSFILDDFLSAHIGQKINVCTYLSPRENFLFAFNIDTITQDESAVKVVSLYILKHLLHLHLTPLIIKSGRGYHFWCRLSAPVENEKLQTLMQYVRDFAAKQASLKNVDIGSVQCTLYPHVNTHPFSIRLFGSRHMKTGLFSSVVTEISKQDTILNEAESWDFFQDFCTDCTIPLDDFHKAYEFILKIIS